MSMQPDVYLDMLISTGKIEPFGSDEVERPYSLTIKNNSSVKIDVAIFGYYAGRRWWKRFALEGKSRRTDSCAAGQFAIACFDPECGKLLMLQSLATDGSILDASDHGEINHGENRPNRLVTVSVTPRKKVDPVVAETPSKERQRAPGPRAPRRLDLPHDSPVDHTKRAAQVGPGQVPGRSVCSPTRGLTSRV